MPCSDVGGRLFEPHPPKFYPHAFNFRATFLCVRDFAQKIVLHHMVKNIDRGSRFSYKGGLKI